jgi:DNA polymerase-3 subunit beta
MNTFKFNPKTLLTGLQAISKAFDGRTNVPICSNYLFELDNDRVKISVTDLRVTYAVTIPVIGGGTSFRAVVPQGIVKYLAKVKSDECIFSWVVESFSAEILTGKERAKFSGDNSEDFPMAPEVIDHVFNTTGAMFGQIKRLLPMMSGDEIRPAINCIGFIPAGTGVNLCVTNGHVLRYEVLPGVSDPFGFLYAPKAARMLAGIKIEGEAVVEVFCNKERVNTKMVFAVGGLKYELTSRNHDERYPDYMAVIPGVEGTKTRLSVNKKEILTTLDKALLFANKQTKMIVFDINGAASITAEDLDFSNEISIPLEKVTIDGEPLKIGFDGDLLGMVADVHGDEFTIDFTTDSKCLTIRDTGAQSVTILMPIKIKQ